MGVEEGAGVRFAGGLWFGEAGEWHVGLVFVFLLVVASGCDVGVVCSVNAETLAEMLVLGLI